MVASEKIFAHSVDLIARLRLVHVQSVKASPFELCQDIRTGCITTSPHQTLVFMAHCILS